MTETLHRGFEFDSSQTTPRPRRIDMSTEQRVFKRKSLSSSCNLNAHKSHENDIRNQRNVHFGHLSAGSSHCSQYWASRHVSSPIEAHLENGWHFFSTLVRVPRSSLMRTVRQTSYRNTSMYSANLMTVTADTRCRHNKHLPALG